MTLALPLLARLPSPNYSARGGQAVRLVVVHDCEGSYDGSVSWFAMPRSQVSAHVVLSEDGARATQMVDWRNKAWHACNFNPFSEGIEAAGYAAKGLDAPEWASLAAIVAWRLRANGLPCQAASAGNNWTGYCQHVDLGVEGGGHHDITLDGIVRARFYALVATAYADAMPANWIGPTAGTVPAAPSGWKPSGTVRHDLSPPSLEWVQMKLNALGAPFVPLIVDGLWGRATEMAVVKFQQTHGLFVDGQPGVNTCAALQAA